MKAKDFQPGVNFKVPNNGKVFTYITDDDVGGPWHLVKTGNDYRQTHFELSHRGIQFWLYHEVLGIRFKSEFFPFSKLTLVP